MTWKLLYPDVAKLLYLPPFANAITSKTAINLFGLTMGKRFASSLFLLTPSKPYAVLERVKN